MTNFTKVPQSITQSRMDEIDRKLLLLLQHDAQVSQAELAKEVGLSVTGVHKRIHKLEQEGFIRRTVVLLDRAKLGLDLLCFLKVTFKNNLDPQNLPRLRKAVEELPEVLECFTLTGSDDGILKVLVKDHVSLRDFLRRFSEAQKVIDRIETCIVLEEFKETSELPIADR